MAFTVESCREPARCGHRSQRAPVLSRNHELISYAINTFHLALNSRMRSRFCTPMRTTVVVSGSKIKSLTVIPFLIPDQTELWFWARGWRSLG